MEPQRKRARLDDPQSGENEIQNNEIAIGNLIQIFEI